MHHPSYTTPLALPLLVTLIACGPDITFDEQARDDLESYSNATTPDSSNGDASRLDALGHGAWDAVVGRYVIGDCFDYDALAASSEGQALLQLYVEQLGRVDLTSDMTRDERFALWVNAYNAMTVTGVLSERALDPAFRVDRDDFSFFKQARYNVGGMVLALDQMEHGVLRMDPDHPTVQQLDDGLKAQVSDEAARIATLDPRLHFAVNCASASCPPLRAAAYRGADLETQLSEQTTRFLDDPGRGAGPEGISMLFTWFEGDFLAEAPIPDFIGAYRTDGLNGVDTSRALPYDWSLNAYDPANPACSP